MYAIYQYHVVRARSTTYHSNCTFSLLLRFQFRFYCNFHSNTLAHTHIHLEHKNQNSSTVNVSVIVSNSVWTHRIAIRTKCRHCQCKCFAICIYACPANGAIFSWCCYLCWLFDLLYVRPLCTQFDLVGVVVILSNFFCLLICFSKWYCCFFLFVFSSSRCL